jgi:hypothetical protein
VALPDNVIAFPERRTAYEAWLSGGGSRGHVSERAWVSGRRRRERALTEDLEGKTF